MQLIVLSVHKTSVKYDGKVAKTQTHTDSSVIVGVCKYFYMLFPPRPFAYFYALYYKQVDST